MELEVSHIFMMLSSSQFFSSARLRHNFFFFFWRFFLCDIFPTYILFKFYLRLWASHRWRVECLCFNCRAGVKRRGGPTWIEMKSYCWNLFLWAHRSFLCVLFLGDHKQNIVIYMIVWFASSRLTKHGKMPEKNRYKKYEIREEETGKCETVCCIEWRVFSRFILT